MTKSTTVQPEIYVSQSDVLYYCNKMTESAPRRAQRLSGKYAQLCHFYTLMRPNASGNYTHLAQHDIIEGQMDEIFFYEKYTKVQQQ